MCRLGAEEKKQNFVRVFVGEKEKVVLLQPQNQTYYQQLKEGSVLK